MLLEFRQPTAGGQFKQDYREFDFSELLAIKQEP